MATVMIMATMVAMVIVVATMVDMATVVDMKVCEFCNAEHNGLFGSGRFCKKACSAAFSTKYNKEIRAAKISAKHVPIVYEDVVCKICRTVETFRKCLNRQVCSNKACFSKALSIAGGNGSRRRTNHKRSLNEILFSEYCQQHFKNILLNARIFDGWDADVVVEDLKVAVHWNGAWHYSVIGNNSLEEIQSRDALKMEAISKCGYIPYVVKDLGKHNPEFVRLEFEKFLSWSGELAITLRS